MKKSLSLILALALMLTLVGCGKNVTVKTPDGNAKISTGSGLSWPKDKMGELPELKSKVLSVVDTPQGTSVTCDGLSKSDYDAYVSKLKAQGFEDTYTMEMEGTSLFTGQKDESTVSVQFHSDSGTCIIIYAVEQ